MSELQKHAEWMKSYTKHIEPLYLCDVLEQESMVVKKSEQQLPGRAWCEGGEIPHEGAWRGSQGW
jgi:hypothetical protein